MAFAYGDNTDHLDAALVIEQEHLQDRTTPVAVVHPLKPEAFLLCRRLLLDRPGTWAEIAVAERFLHLASVELPRFFIPQPSISIVQRSLCARPNESLTFRLSECAQTARPTLLLT